MSVGLHKVEALRVSRKSAHECGKVVSSRYRQPLTLGDIPSTWCVQVPRSTKEAFAAAMQSWRQRCKKCVCLHGDYVEK